MAYYLRSVSKQHNLLLHIETNLIVLLFASPWATRDTPGVLFFVTNKNHSKPLGKGHKINDKWPFPRGKYGHPQHNIFC